MSAKFTCGDYYLRRSKTLITHATWLVSAALRWVGLAGATRNLIRLFTIWDLRRLSAKEPWQPAELLRPNATQSAPGEGIQSADDTSLSTANPPSWVINSPTMVSRECSPDGGAPSNGKSLLSRAILAGAESTLAYAERVSDAAQNSKRAAGHQEICAPRAFGFSEPTNSAPPAEAGQNSTHRHRCSDELFRMDAVPQRPTSLCGGRNVREAAILFALIRLKRRKKGFARQIEIAQRNAERIFSIRAWAFTTATWYSAVGAVLDERFPEHILTRAGSPDLPRQYRSIREEVRCAEPFFCVLAALQRIYSTHKVPRIKAVLETMKVFDPDCAVRWSARRQRKTPFRIRIHCSRTEAVLACSQRTRSGVAIREEQPNPPWGNAKSCASPDPAVW